MDFKKVTGTTMASLQSRWILDPRLTRPIVEGAIARCREARLFIMDTCMKPAISEPRKEVGQYAPKIDQISIDPQKIGDVVGKQGCVINKIIEETGVKIDISEEGNVAICGTDKEMIEKAKSIIKNIVTDIEPGQIITGKGCPHYAVRCFPSS